MRTMIALQGGLPAADALQLARTQGWTDPQIERHGTAQVRALLTRPEATAQARTLQRPPKAAPKAAAKGTKATKGTTTAQPRSVRQLVNAALLQQAPATPTQPKAAKAVKAVKATKRTVRPERVGTVADKVALATSLIGKTARARAVNAQGTVLDVTIKAFHVGPEGGLTLTIYGKLGQTSVGGSFTLSATLFQQLLTKQPFAPTPIWVHAKSGWTLFRD
jgi:hypothetical protein